MRTELNFLRNLALYLRLYEEKGIQPWLWRHGYSRVCVAFILVTVPSFEPRYLVGFSEYSDVILSPIDFF